MTARDRLRGLGAGMVAGLTGGLFGVGGGLALVPLLTAFFGFSQHAAHGTSLAVIGATALVAVAVYAGHGAVAWLTAVPVALGSLATARLGAYLTTRVSPGGLRRAFAVFMALIAIRLLWQPPAVTEHPAVSGLAGLAISFATGLAAGLVAGFMGVGGGVVMVPVFTLLFGMTQQSAQGTSLAVILVTAPLAAIEHSRHGHVAWGLVPVLAIGAALGGPLASWGAQLTPHAWLARAFALFLLATAVHTWTRSAGGPRGRTAAAGR